MYEQEVARTISGKYRLIILDKVKYIQKRNNVNWETIETWPSVYEGGTIGTAVKFMNKLEEYGK